jgi:peroxiredoxin
MEVLRLGLAALFAVAGAAKLADLSGAAQAARSFGAPSAIARPLAALLALLEIAVAVALLPTVSVRWAAWAMAGLLVVFALVVAVARLRGRTPECHCFGRIHSAPAGWGVVGRNLGLAVLAAVVAATPPSPIGAPAVLAFAVVAQTGLVIVLLRRYGRALRRIDELEVETGVASILQIGSPAPPFVLPTAAGPALTLEDLLTPRLPVLLVFADSACGACTALLPELASGQEEEAERLTLAVIAHGDVHQLRAVAREHELERMLLAPDRSLVEAYGLHGTPSAVLVDAEGRIASPALHGADEIEAVLGRASGRWPGEESSTETLVHA